MDTSKLIKAREYYDLKSKGVAADAAALQIYGRKNVKKVEDTDEYRTIVAAASQVEKEKLRQDIERIKRKQIKSYSNLLDKGEELMGEAKTTQEKIAAQANQRANLSTGVVETATAWDGEDRNKLDESNILEGIVL